MPSLRTRLRFPSHLLKYKAVQYFYKEAYFIYKRRIEDPYFNFASCNPERFRGGHVFDVGANIGYTASVFQHYCDSGFQVFAFEPEPLNFEILQRTAGRFAGKVVPQQLAVADRSGEIDLWINAGQPADHRIVTKAFRGQLKPGDREPIAVRATSLDDFYRQLPEPKNVSFIKIDVQGFELPVCLGMTEVLDRCPKAAVGIEFSPAQMSELGFSSDALFSFFADRGYDVSLLLQSGRLEPRTPLNLDRLLRAYGYVDLIFERA